MPDVMNFVNPLSGRELVEDVLGQVRRRLRGDCSLRQEDGYSGGYSGEVTIKLRCHAVRTAVIEMTIPITQSPSIAAPAPSTFAPEDLEPIEIDEKLVIPVEENLVAVRDRIVDNSEKSLEAENEKIAESEGEENIVTPRAKRKYQRRVALDAAVGAGVE